MQTIVQSGRCVPTSSHDRLRSTAMVTQGKTDGLDCDSGGIDRKFDGLKV